MVAADDATVFLVALFAVVGHIDDDGILVVKAVADSVDDGVVIEHGVVIVAHHLALLGRELRTPFLIVRRIEVGALVGIAVAIGHMLTQEVEDIEVATVLGGRVGYLVIVREQSVVILVYLGVAGVKLGSTQRGIVQEEAAAEVVDCLLGFGQELVGEEGDMIPGAAEYLGEEGIVAPLARLSHDVQGEGVLEHKAGEVPRRHHIGKLHKSSAALASRLPWRRRQLIAILLGVVLAVAFTDNQHDGR